MISFLLLLGGALLPRYRGRRGDRFGWPTGPEQLESWWQLPGFIAHELRWVWSIYDEQKG